jgi:hypothetical protein
VRVQPDGIFVMAGATAWDSDDAERLGWLGVCVECEEGLRDGLAEGMRSTLGAWGPMTLPLPRVSSATAGGCSGGLPLRTTSTNMPMLGLTWPSRDRVLGAVSSSLVFLSLDFPGRVVEVVAGTAVVGLFTR